MTEITCPDCHATWNPSNGETCPGCGLSWDDVQAAADHLEQRLAAMHIWPPGILSRVSREAYNAVGRARAFPMMTPEEREAAARSYDQLSQGGTP